MWKVLEEGWIKVNLERTSKGNLGPSGIGVVVRDDIGNTSNSDKKDSRKTNNQVECLVVVEAVLLGMRIRVEESIWKVNRN